MEVWEFTASERRLSRAAALLRERGVSDPQLAWCAERVDRERIGAILNSAEPAWRAFVRAGAAATEDEERRAYVGLAATRPQRLRSALGVEHPKRFSPPAKVREEAARLRERGVSDEEIAAAIRRVGLRPLAEALAGPDNLGWWARGEAMRAATRELAGMYLVLAAADVPRVRAALHLLGVEATRRQRKATEAAPSVAVEVAA
jgi:hypothetical protein